MKVLNFFFAVIMLAVTTVSAASVRIPDTLPYGKNFPGDGVTVAGGITLWDPPAGNPTVGWKTLPYKGNGGFESAAREVIQQLVETFRAPQGKEAADYTLFVDVDIIGVDLDGNETLWPLGNRRLPTWPETFKLESGKIPSKLLDDTRIGYQPYIPAYVRGLKGVLLVIRKSGKEVLREESPNGVWDKTCSQYLGNGGDDGPDVLELKTEYAVPEKRESGIDGEVTVYLSSDHSVWATYNLDGEKLASSEPPPIRLSYRLVKLTATELALQNKRSEVPTLGLEMTVTGPPDALISVEYTKGLLGEWTSLTYLKLANGSATCVDPLSGTARFYRVRLDF